MGYCIMFGCLFILIGFQTASSEAQVPSCECEFSYVPRGCKITVPAPKNNACNCTENGPLHAPKCSGQVVACLDPTSDLCKTPDDSLASCKQGQGNCGGYSENEDQGSGSGCKCKFLFAPRGCKITVPAPENNACKCTDNGPLHAPKCSGELVACLDPTSDLCKAPDNSVASCYEGQGDCGGYASEDQGSGSVCKCKFLYVPRGCKITVPAPEKNACKCTAKGPWYKPFCSGQVVACLDPTSDLCEIPNDSLASCKQGQGDCSGYNYLAEKYPILIQ